MKIIFDNYIKDFDIELRERPTTSHRSPIYITLGRIVLTYNVYNEIARNENNLLSRSFSIVNDDLRQHYQKCIVAGIKIISDSSGNLDNCVWLDFIVTEVGLSSIPIPDLSMPSGNGQCSTNDYYTSNGIRYRYFQSPVLTPSGGVL